MAPSPALGTRDVRPLLLPEQPFALGKNATRPAPAHVANRFVERWLGESGRGRELIRLLKGTGELPTALEYLDRANEATGELSWATDSQQLPELREDLNTVFNPDGRAWEAIGSLVPVHAAFTTRDASDNGLGTAVAELTREHLTESYRDELRSLVVPADATTPLDAAALILSRGAVEPTAPSLGTQSDAWFADSDAAAATMLAENLASFCRALTDLRTPAARTTQIQHLSRGLYFIATLSAFLGPVAREHNGSPTGIDEICPALVLGQVPPGPSSGPLLAASARSLRRIVERTQSALAVRLAAVLPTLVPSGTAAADKVKVALTTQAQRGRLGKDDADELADRIIADSRIAAASTGKPDEIRWCSEIVEVGYPAEILVSGLRTMGRKIGFVGPDRSAAVPRFLAETPLLGTLVAGLCPEGGTDFVTFVDLLRTRLGLVFGEGTEALLADRLNLWESPGVGRQLLAQNQEMLRQRLVRAGLAREYSDGHTEVFLD